MKALVSNRVYFSNKDSWDGEWADGHGTINVFLYPRKWWSIKDWKMTIMFMKDGAL